MLDQSDPPFAPTDNQLILRGILTVLWIVATPIWLPLWAIGFTTHHFIKPIQPTDDPRCW